MFRSHSSIFFSLHVFIIDIQVSIKNTDKNTALKEIGCLTKALQDTDLSGNILKEDAEYFSEFICTQINDLVCSSQFSTFFIFKCANITPISKNDSRNHKNNYRPVRIFPKVLNIFEKVMN